MQGSAFLASVWIACLTGLVAAQPTSESSPSQSSRAEQLKDQLRSMPRDAFQPAIPSLKNPEAWRRVHARTPPPPDVITPKLRIIAGQYALSIVNPLRLQTIGQVRKDQRLSGPGGIARGTRLPPIGIIRSGGETSYQRIEEWTIKPQKPMMDVGNEEGDRAETDRGDNNNLQGVPRPNVARGKQRVPAGPASVTITRRIREYGKRPRESERIRWWKPIDWWHPAILQKDLFDICQRCIGEASQIDDAEVAGLESGYITDIDASTSNMSNPRVDQQLLMDETSLDVPAAQAARERAMAESPAAPGLISGREQGMRALAEGRAQDAMGFFENALQTDASPELQRWVGMSQLAAGHVNDATASVIEAYAKDPALATHPLPEGLFGDRDAFRAARNRASVEANKANTASAWLMLGVLMQAEGRPDRALEMIKRAEKMGLDKSVVSAFDRHFSSTSVRR